MDDNLFQQLQQNHPELLNGGPTSISHFDVGDGWFHILDQLLYAIGAEHVNAINRLHALTNPDCPFHGEDLENHRIRWMTEIERTKPLLPTIVQVKEKFGQLRFYYNGGESYVEHYVHMAERMASVTCYICGAHGRLRTNGWAIVKCDNC